MTVGQVYSFVNMTGDPHSDTATIQSNQLDAAVYAVQLNGYVFAPASTTSSITSTGSSSALGLASETTSTSTGSATSGTSSPTNISTSSGLSTGAKAGIGIGVALGVIGIASLVLALFIVKRRKGKNTGPSDDPSAQLGGGNSYYAPVSPAKRFGIENGNKYEMDPQNKTAGTLPVYEVSGEGVRREIR